MQFQYLNRKTDADVERAHSLVAQYEKILFQGVAGLTLNLYHDSNVVKT
jgi:hypothetical protein